MRWRVIRIGVLAAASSCWLLACGGDDGNGDDNGAAGSGGGNCPSFEACGGDPVGNWQVSRVCVENPEAFVEMLANDPACRGTLKSVENVNGSGSYDLGADMMATSNIVVTATGEFSFTDACVKALGVAQSAAGECAKVETELEMADEIVMSATCAAAGSNCDCTVQSEQRLMSSAAYSVSGSNINVNNVAQPFCVMGNALKLRTSSNGVTVTLDFTK